MRIVQRGSFIKEDSVDILQESMRRHQHHDELSINLLGVVDVNPELGKELEMKGNTVQSHHGRQVNQGLGDILVVDRQADHEVNQTVVGIKVSLKRAVIVTVLAVMSLKLRRGDTHLKHGPRRPHGLEVAKR